MPIQKRRIRSSVKGMGHSVMSKDPQSLRENSHRSSSFTGKTLKALAKVSRHVPCSLTAALIKVHASTIKTVRRRWRANTNECREQGPGGRDHSGAAANASAALQLAVTRNPWNRSRQSHPDLS